VCFTPGEYAYYKDEIEIVFVIDVLRTTSAICAALDNGIKAIIPVPTVEETWEYEQKGFFDKPKSEKYSVFCQYTAKSNKRFRNKRAR
jgi:hypothetical protein